MSHLRGHGISACFAVANVGVCRENGETTIELSVVALVEKTHIRFAGGLGSWLIAKADETRAVGNATPRKVLTSCVRQVLQKGDPVRSWEKGEVYSQTPRQGEVAATGAP